MCIAPPEAVLEAIEARPPTARTAGVIELLGDADRARATRQKAWTRHDDAVARVDAAIMLALRGEVDALGRAADELEARADEGAVRPHDLARALTALGCAAAACSNERLADSILLRRESRIPGPVLPIRTRVTAVGNPRHLLGAIGRILAAMAETEDPVRQGALLLRAHRLAASVDAREFDHVRTLIDRARDGGGGALLSLVLHRVDEGTRAAAGPTPGVLNYMDFLAGRPTDRGERHAFRRRRAWLTSGAWPALDASLTDEERHTVEQDEAYVEALRARDTGRAGELALARARHTNDTALAVAWNVRALLLLGRSASASSRVSHAARLLASRLQLHPRPLPAVESFASEVMFACLVEQGRFDELVDERDPSSAAERLAVACWSRVARGDAVPAALAARFATDERFGAWAASVVLSVDDIDAFCAHLDGSGADVDALTWAAAARAGCSAHVAADAWGTLLERAAELSAPTLVPLSWACAWRRDDLPHWAERAAAVEASDAVVHAARIGRLEASVFVDVTPPVDDEAILALLDDDPARIARIRGRLAARESHRRASGTWRAVTDAFDAVRDEPTLFDRFDAGRAALAEGHAELAARCFSGLADDVSDDRTRARMLALAARAAALVDPDEGLVLAHRTLALDLADPSSIDSAWAVLSTCASPSALLGAAATHGAPIGAVARAALAGALVAQPAAPAAADAARALAVSVHDDLPLAAVDDELRAVTAAVEAGVDADGIEAAWRMAASETRSPARRSVLEHAADAVAALGTDPVTAALDRAARADWSNRALEALASAMASRADEVASALESRLDEVPASRRSAVLDVAADLAERGGQLERARALARQATALTGRAPRSHRILADRAAERGAWNEAAGHLETAGRGESDPGRRAALYRRLGDIYADRIGHRASALENWLVAFIIHSDDDATLARLEETYRTEKRWKDLVGVFEVALAHARDHETRVDVDDVLLKKAEVEYRHLRQPARAGATLLQALDRRPEDEHAARILVQALAPHVDRSDLERALVRHLDAVPEQVATARRNDPNWAIWLPALPRV